MAIQNLKSQLTTLVQLQAIDSQIYKLNEEKKLKPQEMEAIKAAFEEKKAGLAAAEKNSVDLAKEKKERELDLAAKEDAAKKLQSQLYQLKTNKEYNAMLQQIQDAKADASLIEDKILEVMERVEGSKAQIEQEKKKLAQEEQVYSGQKKQIEEQLKQIDEKLVQLTAQRSQVLPSIDKEILSQYERILKNRDGLAIVLVRKNSCMGCNMFVPAQVINLIQMYEKIMTCEVCNRILYIDEQS